MTTSINPQGSGSESQQPAATEATAAGAPQAFRQPDSVVPGVTPGLILDSAEPNRHEVRMKDMWEYQKDHMNLVSPLNRRKFTVLVVGTGLSGGAAAAALGELGYNVKVFTYHDAPRRAHSIAAQGGVNSARGKKVDNDGAYRHVKDTVKGGDYRCRESDCWRLAIESVRVIDHMNAIGAPFAASTAAPWPPAPSAACRSRARTTPAAKRASSCSCPPRRPCSVRSTWATWRSSPTTT